MCVCVCVCVCVRACVCACVCVCAHVCFVMNKCAVCSVPECLLYDAAVGVWQCYCQAAT